LYFFSGNVGTLFYPSEDSGPLTMVKDSSLKFTINFYVCRT